MIIALSVTDFGVLGIGVIALLVFILPRLAKFVDSRESSPSNPFSPSSPPKDPVYESIKSNMMVHVGRISSTNMDALKDLELDISALREYDKLMKPVPSPDPAVPDKDSSKETKEDADAAK